MRVLYVEDDDTLASAVEKMLRQQGYSCDRARSGVGGVKLGQENRYDVILLDVMLPDIDGYEVLRQLQEAGVETPVLIQSGLVDRDKAIDGLCFGVDDFLIKPFNRDELIRRVKQAAGRAGGAEPAADDGPATGNRLPSPDGFQARTRPAIGNRVPTPDAAADGAPPPPNSSPALSATILAGDGLADIDCTIVSVATGGAVLDVTDETVECPDQFLLAVAGDKSYRCEACWRHGGKIGVQFI